MAAAPWTGDRRSPPHGTDDTTRRILYEEKGEVHDAYKDPTKTQNSLKSIE